jgi:hypothetical protein
MPMRRINNYWKTRKIRFSMKCAVDLFSIVFSQLTRYMPAARICAAAGDLVTVSIFDSLTVRKWQKLKR